MINPFLDFKTYREEESGIPLDRIIRTKERVMDRIMEGYIKLIEEEAKELVWLVEDSHIELFEERARTLDIGSPAIDGECECLQALRGLTAI